MTYSNVHSGMCRANVRSQEGKKLQSHKKMYDIYGRPYYAVIHSQ